jgi:hypothetical protein
MSRNTNAIKNKLDELEQQLPGEDPNKTLKDELDFIGKIFESKDCEDYKAFMRTGNTDSAQSILDKHPDNEKELIKDAWMLEVEYGDVFELVALQPVVDINQLNK